MSLRRVILLHRRRDSQRGLLAAGGLVSAPETQRTSSAPATGPAGCPSLRPAEPGKVDVGVGGFHVPQRFPEPCAHLLQVPDVGLELRDVLRARRNPSLPQVPHHRQSQPASLPSALPEHAHDLIENDSSRLKFGQVSQGHLNEYERPGPGRNRPSPSRQRPPELTDYLLLGATGHSFAAFQCAHITGPLRLTSELGGPNGLRGTACLVFSDSETPPDGRAALQRQHRLRRPDHTRPASRVRALRRPGPIRRIVSRVVERRGNGERVRAPGDSALAGGSQK